MPAWGGTGSLAILLTGIVSALIAVLYWALRTTDRALERSNSVMTTSQTNLEFVGSNMKLVQALRTAIFLQGEQIGELEEWALEVRSMWRAQQRELMAKGIIDHVSELPVTPRHLDLTELFEKIQAPNVQLAQPKMDTGTSPSFFDRFLRPGGGGS